MNWRPGPYSSPPAGGRAPISPQKQYRGHTFSMDMPDGWKDKSLYVLAGPVADNIQHNIAIVVDHDVPVDGLVDYVDWQLVSLEKELKGYQLLKKDPATLRNGMAAYRVIYCWYPTEQQPLYQEQLFVLHRQTGYKLTATFTKKTRKILGPEVERMMLSFSPDS